MLLFFPRLLRFCGRVLSEFRRNRGFLLAGALGYNTLLSIVPLFALVVVVLSTVIDGAVLVEVVGAQVDALLPGRSGVVTEAFAAFVDKRAAIGVVGFGVLLFFSAVAFRMLDEAFAIVFQRNRRVRAAHRFRAFILPLAYVFLIGVGVLALTLVMIAFDALPEQGVRWFGLAIGADTAVPLIKSLAFVGLVLLVSSFYWAMPVAHIAPRRALIGGLVASLMWEAVRSIMVWYFETLSLVDIVYGSLGTVIVVLLGLEVAAIIFVARRTDHRRARACGVAGSRVARRSGTRPDDERRHRSVDLRCFSAALAAQGWASCPSSVGGDRRARIVRRWHVGC